MARCEHDQSFTEIKAMLTYSLEELDDIRLAELDLLMQRYATAFSNADLLEIGAGTCRQLTVLGTIARLAVGIDMLGSNYSPSQGSKFVRYDGLNIPFGSNSFDVIFSSNVMEHVIGECELHREMRRVLRPNGIAIHVVPSSTWRLWTMAAYYLVLPRLILNFIRRQGDQNIERLDVGTKSKRKRSLLDAFVLLLCPQRHGEKGNRFTEWWHFRKPSWRRRFESLGWTVMSVEGVGLFYSGYLVGSQFFSIGIRKRFSRLLGSSCLVFVLRSKSVL
jgi:SAM-dependent methyltransferase